MMRAFLMKELFLWIWTSLQINLYVTTIKNIMSSSLIFDVYKVESLQIQREGITLKQLQVIFMLFLAIMLSFNLCGVAFAASQPILSSKTGKQAHLRFLSGPNGGQWFMMGEKIAGVLTSGVLPTSNRIGGGLSNINEVNKKSC